MKKYLSIFIILSVISCGKQKNTIGKQIEGDFNGDNKEEIASLKTRIINDSLKMTEFSIVFSDSTIEPQVIQISNYKVVKLINEGDLNGDNADDISISYENNNRVPISNMETRSYKNEWGKMIEVFSIHGGFDTLSSKELQSIVTKKGDSIIYYTYGESFVFDENLKLKNAKKERKAVKIK